MTESETLLFSFLFLSALSTDAYNNGRPTEGLGYNHAAYRRQLKSRGDSQDN